MYAVHVEGRSSSDQIQVKNKDPATGVLQSLGRVHVLDTFITVGYRSIGIRCVLVLLVPTPRLQEWKGCTNRFSEPRFVPSAGCSANFEISARPIVAFAVRNQHFRERSLPLPVHDSNQGNRHGQGSMTTEGG